MSEGLLFLTGKLAEPGFRRILEGLQGPARGYEVLNIGMSVAALMSAEMISRRLDGARGADRVIVPGLGAGDLTVPAARLGVPVLRGPEDMKDLPGFLGRGGVPPDLSRYDIRRPSSRSSAGFSVITVFSTDRREHSVAKASPETGRG